MDQSVVGWVALAIAVFVYLDLLFVEVRRIVLEAMRIVRRIVAYADLPVVKQAGRAGDDVERLTLALDQIAPLMERAQLALATIRARMRYNPFVPNGSDASKGISAD